MSSDDIANLFRQFGGSADNYKELGRDNVVRQSRERWPLLANMRAEDAARHIESVRVGEEHRHDGPAPLVFDEAAAERAAAEARTPVPAPVARPVVETVAGRPVAHVEPVLQPETFVEVVAEPTAPAVSPVRASASAQIPARAPAFAAQPPATRAAAHAPATVRVPAPAGTELQGLFSRLAHQPEPTAAVADPEVSLLRRLLKP